MAAVRGGRLVDEDRLIAALETCDKVNAGEPITIFEIITAAALYLFAENPADVLLLEVGLGGRYDATNVIERPVVTVITPATPRRTAPTRGGTTTTPTPRCAPAGAH